ncbi:MAG: MlaD family protein [Pseudomonadota bacterium]
MTTPDLPDARMVPRLRSPISLIWIVPLVAVLIGLGLAVNALLQRGPEIELQFVSAEGLEANKTRLKYKDVDIGTVTAIALADDRRTVKVTVQMDRQAAPLLVDDSRFWVVRPRIAAGSVSGLNTLLSGACIALDPGKSDRARRRFVGLESPPLVVGDMPGRQFVLVAADLGSLDVGAPVYFRHIAVGRVVTYAMGADGKGVDVRIFVDAPYDRFITAATRFWHASGIDLSVGADGMKLEMQSLLSLAAGGIAFAGGDASEAGLPDEALFTLFPDQTTAFRQPDSMVQKYVLVFDESVRGVTVGAPVDFRGLLAGEVSRIDIDFKRGSSDVAMAVEISLYPERFVRQERIRPTTLPTPQAIRQSLDGMVAKGLRAQLRTGNLLTGQRYVALDFFPKSKVSAINWNRPTPELPTHPGSLDSLQAQLLTVVDALHGTLQRTDRLIEHIDQDVVPELAPMLRDARQTLNHASAVLASDSPIQMELRDTLRDARQTLDRASAVLESDSPLQTELRDTLREVGRSATAVRNLADMLEQQPQALITGKRTGQ